MKYYMLSLILALAAAAPVAAQPDFRWEVTPHYGFRFGGGINVQPNNLPQGSPPFNRFNVQSSGSGGIGGGAYVTEHVLLNFDWTRQSSNIDGRVVGGPTQSNLAGYRLDTYHFGLNYHFMDEDSKLRPFIHVGLGWSNSGVDAPNVNNFTRFSGGFGGGVKYFFSKNVGLFSQIRYLPTFVYSEPGGVWCNWWGVCWVVPNTNYLNQGDLQFGASFRF